MQQIDRTVLISTPGFYGMGLAAALQSAGYQTELIEKPSNVEVNGSKKKVGFLIFVLENNKTEPGVEDLILSFLDRINPETMVLVSGQSELRIGKINRLRSLGVNAVLSSGTTPEKLIQTMNLLPEHWILNNETVDSRNTLSSLTKREKEVANLLIAGNSVKQIATSLYLSVKTIEVHKYNLMRKLDVHNSSELIVRFYSENN